MRRRDEGNPVECRLPPRTRAGTRRTSFQSYEAATRRRRACPGHGVANSRTVDIATSARRRFRLAFSTGAQPLDVDLASQLRWRRRGGHHAHRARPVHEHYHASRLLDNGAQGIVAPHVEPWGSAAHRHGLPIPAAGQALGGRGCAAMCFQERARRRRHAAHEPGDDVIVSSKRRKAIAGADAIAQVQGVDVL